MKFNEFEERYRLIIILILYVLTTVNCLQLQWYQNNSNIFDNVKYVRPRFEMKLEAPGRMFGNGQLRSFNSILNDINPFSIQLFTVKNELVRHNSNFNYIRGPSFILTNRNDSLITNTILTSNGRPIFRTDNYTTVMKKSLLSPSQFISNTWSNISEENSQIGDYVLSQKAPTFKNISQEVNASLNKLSFLNIKNSSDGLILKQEEISIGTRVPSPSKKYRKLLGPNKLCSNISNRCITRSTVNTSLKLPQVNTTQRIEFCNTTTESTTDTKDMGSVGLSQYVLQLKSIQSASKEVERRLTWNENGSRSNLFSSTVDQINENSESKNNLPEDELKSNFNFSSLTPTTSLVNIVENLRLKQFTVSGGLEEAGMVEGNDARKNQTNYNGINMKELVLKPTGKYKRMDYNRFVEEKQETRDRYYSMLKPGDSRLVQYKNHGFRQEFGWNKRKSGPYVASTFTGPPYSYFTIEHDLKPEKAKLENYNITSANFIYLNHKSLITVAQDDTSSGSLLQKPKKLFYSDITSKNDLERTESKETTTNKSVVDEKDTSTSEEPCSSPRTARFNRNHFWVLNEEERIFFIIITPVVGILLLVIVILVTIILIKRKQLKLYNNRDANKRQKEYKPLLTSTTIENDKMLFRHHKLSYLPRKSSTTLFNLASPSTSVLSVADGPTSQHSHVPKVKECSPDDLSIVDAYLKFHRSLPTK